MPDKWIESRGKLTITRSKDEAIRIEIRDVDKKRNILRLNIDPAGFAFAVTGCGRQECVIEVNIGEHEDHEHETTDRP